MLVEWEMSIDIQTLDRDAKTIGEHMIDNIERKSQLNGLKRVMEIRKTVKNQKKIILEETQKKCEERYWNYSGTDSKIKEALIGITKCIFLLKVARHSTEFLGIAMDKSVLDKLEANYISDIAYGILCIFLAIIGMVIAAILLGGLFTIPVLLALIPAAFGVGGGVGCIDESKGKKEYLW